MRNRLNVLLVEDNPGDARLIREMLFEQHGFGASYTVGHADDLGKAKEKCSTEDFNVVLLDLNLPDSTGLETLKQFYEFFPEIPIIVLTGLNDEFVSFMAAQHGALSYVVKDECTPSLLTRAIQYAIERKRLEEYFKHLATHDSLTGLPNRSLFYDRLSQAIHHAERNRVSKIPKWKLAIMLIDLDHFKTINDTLGHAQGDAMLQLAAQRLSAALRDSDTVARLGGDEFLILVESILDQKDCEIVAKKLLQSLNRSVLPGDNQATLQASIGISIFPDDATDTETLICYADTAMYAAKKQCNEIRFYKDLPKE